MNVRVDQRRLRPVRTSHAAAVGGSGIVRTDSCDIRLIELRHDRSPAAGGVEGAGAHAAARRSRAESGPGELRGQFGATYPQQTTPLERTVIASRLEPEPVDPLFVRRHDYDLINAVPGIERELLPGVVAV